ncbi:MAG: DUF4382 domain-containing protein [Salinimicrobium sp.]
MKKYQLFVLLFALTAGFVSCSKDDDSGSSEEGKAHVTVKMTDAPGDYYGVFVDVEEVMVNTSTEADADAEAGWQTIATRNDEPINLLELTGGVTELLAEADLPAGYLGKIRLVLGENNYLKETENGPQIMMNTPSAQQSGLKLQVNQELQADADYTFILDFDVDESVVNTGNGGYNLKPVIRASVEENSSSISGTVVGNAEDVLVTATGLHAEVSAHTNAEGKFELHGLPQGTYLITATPNDGSGLHVAMVNNVEVESGATVNLDPIYLEPLTE